MQSSKVPTESVPVDQWDAEDFLELVWGEKPGWVDLPSKVGAYWVPWYHSWKGEADSEVTQRIDSCLRDGESLYFSVLRFKERGRANESARGAHWLWADLDEVAPQEAGREGLLPTIAWESSPGRYQAMWKLDQKLSPASLEKLNRALSYHLGADSGGWDLSQVLRLPGTRNFKPQYEGAPSVKLLWYDEGISYNAARVWQRVKHHHREDGEGAAGILPRKPIPARASALLRVGADSVVEGERSARMWEIECLLAEAGWGEDEIIAVVAECAWNKWAEVRTGERRLRREVRKAITHVRRKRVLGSDDDDGDGSKEEGDDVGESLGGRDKPALPLIRYASFMAMELEEPRWLIDGIWSAGSHGIIGGEPKTSKTTLALAMALSVASGKPFLNTYPVRTQGPALVIQEENPPWQIQERLRKLAAFYGLITSSGAERSAAGSLYKQTISIDFPADAPMHILNNWGFNLMWKEHREALETEVDSIRPALLVLDPMYLIFGGVDYDKAKDLYPFLSYLMHLRYEYGCAIALIHHYRKAGAHGAQQGGQRLMGNAVLHGWVDSAFYTENLSTEGDKDLRIKLTREFRNVEPQSPLEVILRPGAPGDLALDAEINPYSLGTLIKQLAIDNPGITIVQAAEKLSVDKRTVLRHARGEGHIDITTVAAGRGKSYQLSVNGYGLQEGE